MIHAGVPQSHRQVGAAFTGGDDGHPLKVLEVDVPQPGQVLTIGHLAVDRDHHPVGTPVDHRQRLLPPGRVLGQQNARGVLADRDGLVATRDLVHGGNGGHRGSRIGAECDRGRHRLGGVAPVDRPRQRQPHR